MSASRDFSMAGLLEYIMRAIEGINLEEHPEIVIFTVLMVVVQLNIHRYANRQSEELIIIDEAEAVPVGPSTLFAVLNHLFNGLAFIARGSLVLGRAIADHSQPIFSSALEYRFHERERRLARQVLAPDRKPPRELNEIQFYECLFLANGDKVGLANKTGSEYQFLVRVHGNKITHAFETTGSSLLTSLDSKGEMLVRVWDGPFGPVFNIYKMLGAEYRHGGFTAGFAHVINSYVACTTRPLMIISFNSGMLLCDFRDSEHPKFGEFKAAPEGVTDYFSFDGSRVSLGKNFTLALLPDEKRFLSANTEGLLLWTMPPESKELSPESKLPLSCDFIDRSNEFKTARQLAIATDGKGGHVLICSAGDHIHFFTLDANLIPHKKNKALGSDSHFPFFFAVVPNKPAIVVFTDGAYYLWDFSNLQEIRRLATYAISSDEKGVSFRQDYEELVRSRSRSVAPGADVKFFPFSVRQESNYVLSLMADEKKDEKQVLAEGHLYLKKMGNQLHYCVIHSGVVTEGDIKQEDLKGSALNISALREPLNIAELKPFSADILQVTSGRNHTFVDLMIGTPSGHEFKMIQPYRALLTTAKELKSVVDPQDLRSPILSYLFALPDQTPTTRADPNAAPASTAEDESTAADATRKTDKKSSGPGSGV